jgi:signal transduction histidine kinase
LAFINQAKRAFIRYVFHEVRVPFNAIVLGTEQLQLQADRVGGQLGSDMREMTVLISEQAKVVARILNGT